MNSTISLENRMVAAIFVFAVGFFGISSIISCITIKEQYSVLENRRLAPLPGFHTFRKDIFTFANNFDTYFKDRFAFRTPLAAARNILALDVFRSSGGAYVALGKDGWLFYNDNWSASRAQHNWKRFHQEELLSWVRSIRARNDFCAVHNIKYLLVIAPEKGSIYPEQLPEGWNRRSGISRLEQLQDYLRSHTNVDLVDAQSILKKKKAEGVRVYLTNDCHWNDLGALYVACDIVRHLTVDCPNVGKLTESDFRIGKSNVAGDLSKMLGLAQAYLDRDCPSPEMLHPLAAVPDTKTQLPYMPPAYEPAGAMRTSNDRLPRVLVLRDSFARSFVPYLSGSFSFTEYQWTNLFLPDAVLEEKPNIVINEIAERHLSDFFYDHVPLFLTRDGSPEPANQVMAKGPQSPIPAGGQTISFADKFALLSLTATPNEEGLLLKLLWQAKKPAKLEYAVGVSCLNNDQQEFAHYDYHPDILARDVEAGSTWLDTVQVPPYMLPLTETIRISMYRNNKGKIHTLDCDGATAGATFVAFTVKDLEKNSKSFEQTYVANGGSASPM